MSHETTAADSLDDLFESFSHEVACDLKLKDRGPDPAKTANPSETLSSKMWGQIQIHDESDKTKIVTQTLPAQLVEKEGDRASLIVDRQKEVLSHLNVPGMDRHLMPAIPAKSKRLRDAENPGFYPFCQLATSDAERMLMLKHLQQLVKANFIDGGVSASQRHNKYKAFERSFQNHMSPEIFRQVYNEAMLDNPERASLYFPRTDSLLLALFNRHSSQETTAMQPAQSEVDIPEFFLGEEVDGL